MSKAGYLQQGMLRGVFIAAAILIVSALAFYKTHAAEGNLNPKSGDGGKPPWEKTAGPPGLTVNVIYEVGSVVYAGTERQGVYKSTDNGLNWIAANNGIERTSISDMIVSGENLLAANKSGCSSSLNVFKSTDGGVTWSSTTGLNGRIVKSFAIKGSFIYAASAFFPGSSGVSRSSDSGNTWQEVASPITFNGNKIFVSDNAIILASDNIIWRSLNDGASWDPVEQFALSGISSFARAGTKLFAAGGLVIWTSLNNGGSWTSSVFSNGAYSFSSNGSTIYLGSRSKVFKSTDLGATWIDVSTGLGHGGIRALLYDGNNLFAGTPGDAAGMYRSTNGGTSWEPAPAGLPIGSEVRSMISLGGYLFAGMNGDGIYRSSDHGDTWAKTDIDNSLLAHEFVHTFCIKDNALFAGATNGIYKSTDGGATFLRILNGFPANTNVNGSSLTVSSGNIITAVDVSLSPSGFLEAIFYSSDNGSNWHQSNLPVNATSVPAVASDGSPLAYAGVFAQTSSATGLYKSTDAGLTWVSRTATMSADIERLAVKGSNVLASTIFTAFYSTDFGESFAPSSPPHPPDICPGGCGIATYTLRGSSIFAGNQAGMFLSTDSGASWTTINEGFPVCPIPVVESSCTDSNNLFAGTASAGEGVWRKPIDLPPDPTPTPGPSATVSPTATATPTANPAATATPSLTPTPTPIATSTPTPGAQAINLSTRMFVQTGNNVGIGGFIITGTAPKHVILRAIGPSLAQSGVPNALADPVLELHGPGAFVTVVDNNWRDDPVQAALIEADGIPPTNDLESAIDATLPPGAYTAIVRGNGNMSGIGLVEVYDLSQATAAKLANISTRAFVDTGNNIVIAGFILGGNSGNDRIVARGIGPSLTAAGVPDALADPTLELRDSNGTLLVANDDWLDDAAQAAELIAAGFNSDNTMPSESAIATTLPPGLYTALLAGMNNTTGVGVVEIYDRGSAPAHLKTNLVSDLPGLAPSIDPNLTNPWGIATSPTSPFWVADNHSGLSTLYNSSGTPSSLVVTVPPATGGTQGSPTGIVYNASSDFQVAAGAAARFIFATEDGTISGWSQAAGATAVLKVDNSASTAVYKGLAIGNNGTANYLYAANFHAGRIDVFDATYAPAVLAGNFADPSIPAGYAPFNIQSLGVVLYVTYALQDASGADDVPGVGHGFINTFDFNGNLLGRFASRGALNSPWGVALAPAGFGAFANDLLVGNFGDGRIEVFDPATGAYLGQLADGFSHPISIEGLWGLKVGNGGNGGDSTTLYFAAGIAGPDQLEDHGLFGSLVPQ